MLPGWLGSRCECDVMPDRYVYSDYRQALFTDSGQRLFLIIRDRVDGLLHESGAFTMGAAVATGMIHDIWEAAACVDRLAELGEIVEITEHGKVPQAYRVFTRTRD